jgi:Spy/CpxP family protein refolding chaperone
MFRSSLSRKFVLVIVAFVTFAVSAFSQDGLPPSGEHRPPNDQRPDIVRQLGLSPDQIRAFADLNKLHRPIIGEAQRKMREANRELDMAIYADEVSDELVYAKVQAFQTAQAEVNLLRFRHELAIRKILTHDQLVRFREIRRRFAESRQDRRENMMPRRGNPALQRRNQQPRIFDNQKRPVI